MALHYVLKHSSKEGLGKYEVLLMDVPDREPHDRPDFFHARSRALFNCLHAGRAMNYMNGLREGWPLPVLLWNPEPTDDRSAAYELACALKALGDDDNFAALFTSS